MNVFLTASNCFATSNHCVWSIGSINIVNIFGALIDSSEGGIILAACPLDSVMGCVAQSETVASIRICFARNMLMLPAASTISENHSR